MAPLQAIAKKIDPWMVTAPRTDSLVVIVPRIDPSMVRAQMI
jgi:hypothetical protein